jgi:hypothetical protein
VIDYTCKTNISVSLIVISFGLTKGIASLDRTKVAYLDHRPVVLLPRRSNDALRSRWDFLVL